jgi:MOSC domain-containing protein YiiM
VAKLISVNVGTPRELGASPGKKVISAIVKLSVEGPVIVRRLNLEGDHQADLTVHGGENKAVYAYPSEHYKFWKKKFPLMDLPWGSFGENLTTQGLFERNVHVGDHFVIGSATFEVTKPRFPCFKLATKFGAQEMIKWFLDSERSGFYLRVAREGEIRAGEAIKRTLVNKSSQTITSMLRDVKKTE